MKKLLKDICDFFNGLLGKVFGEKVKAEDIELDEEDLAFVDSKMNEYKVWLNIADNEEEMYKNQIIDALKQAKADDINGSKPINKVKNFVVGLLVIATFIFLLKFAAFKALLVIFVVIPVVLLLAGLFVGLFAMMSIF